MMTKPNKSLDHHQRSVRQLSLYVDDFHMPTQRSTAYKDTEHHRRFVHQRIDHEVSHHLTTAPLSLSGANYSSFSTALTA